MTHDTHDRIRRWVSLPVAASEIWARIGDFGAMADWHPLVRQSPVLEIGGATHRHLTLEDEGLSVERLVGTGPRHYSYAVIDGPFPVNDCTGTLSAVPEADGCHVFWSMDFEPTDPVADDIIAGFIEAGLRSLRGRFGATAAAVQGAPH